MPRPRSWAASLSSARCSSRNVKAGIAVIGNGLRSRSAQSSPFTETLLPGVMLNPNAQNQTMVALKQDRQGNVVPCLHMRHESFVRMVL
jgi:hypothetical protein